MSKLKTFELTFPVLTVSGYQVYEVEAESAEDAKARFNAGEGDFVCEEIEVTNLGEPEVEEDE